MPAKDQQLALSTGLTLKTNQLCLGLKSGAADILELVTPTTAELLKWWFGEDMVLARSGLNFHAGQKQAILNAIMAHEVLGKDHKHWTLLDLYRAAAPDALLTGTRLSEVASPKHGYPKYCFKMATGTGKTWVMQALSFQQIITDFDLKSAMRAGLVKSLVLDRRKEIGALPLEFKAERDEDGNPVLSEGQRVMLRAGLQKLRKLETDFARIDPTRFPKMLVVCEDTTVSPLVDNFLQEEGLAPGEVMVIDSGKKAELGEKDWLPVRQRLFSVDSHPIPKVIVSVLMLREGFDVNNICVIVPLRSSQAQILLEQTIGRGLRLMWRDDEYTDLKRENRERGAPDPAYQPGLERASA